MPKLNFGCGHNKLEGWENYDTDIDISKSLPFPDAYADAVYAEHCVEHIDIYQAISFFKECYRILRFSGVIRISVPAVDKILKLSTPDYFHMIKISWERFSCGQKVPEIITHRDAIHSILYFHGHKSVWSLGILSSLLYYAGFDEISSQDQGESNYDILKHIEGHQILIGKEFNNIESIICEGRKP